MGVSSALLSFRLPLDGEVTVINGFFSNIRFAFCSLRIQSNNPPSTLERNLPRWPSCLKMKTNQTTMPSAPVALRLNDGRGEKSEFRRVNILLLGAATIIHSPIKKRDTKDLFFPSSSSLFSSVEASHASSRLPSLIFSLLFLPSHPHSIHFHFPSLSSRCSCFHFNPPSLHLPQPLHPDKLALTLLHLSVIFLPSSFFSRFFPFFFPLRLLPSQTFPS